MQHNLTDRPTDLETLGILLNKHSDTHGEGTKRGKNDVFCSLTAKHVCAIHGSSTWVLPRLECCISIPGSPASPRKQRANELPRATSLNHAPDNSTITKANAESLMAILSSKIHGKFCAPNSVIRVNGFLPAWPIKPTEGWERGRCE